MSVEDIKKAIHSLKTEEWNEIFSWVLSEERPYRDALPVRAAAEVETIKRLRAEGVIPSPTKQQIEPEAKAPEDLEKVYGKYVEGVVYLPGETVFHDGKVYSANGPGVTKEKPSDNSDAWTVYRTAEDAPVADET